MNAYLRKLTVCCLVLVLAGASWAANCKGNTGDDGKSEPTKTCKSKDGPGNDDKAGCQKGGDTTDKPTDKTG